MVNPIKGTPDEGSEPQGVCPLLPTTESMHGNIVCANGYTQYPETVPGYSVEHAWEN